jgi:hypothetical protein
LVVARGPANRAFRGVLYKRTSGWS